MMTPFASSTYMYIVLFCKKQYDTLHLDITSLCVDVPPESYKFTVILFVAKGLLEYPKPWYDPPLSR